ncbi:MAG TPA: hypothetical protein VLE96_03960 [Chlamydiales bacterium]|nr:hypothetical protein [Chlamydiales bacterium]
MSINNGIQSYILPGRRFDVDGALKQVFGEKHVNFAASTPQNTGKRTSRIVEELVQKEGLSNVPSQNGVNIRNLVMERLHIPSSVVAKDNVPKKRPIEILEKLPDHLRLKLQRTQGFFKPNSVGNLGGNNDPYEEETMTAQMKEIENFIGEEDQSQKRENEKAYLSDFLSDKCESVQTTIMDDFLTSCKSGKLKKSQMVELPRMALEEIKDSGQGVPEIKFAKFFPENNQVQFFDNKVQFIPKEDLEICEKYRLDLDEVDSSNFKNVEIKSVGKILEEIILSGNIRDEELDELKKGMISNLEVRIRPNKALSKISKIQLKFKRMEEGLAEQKSTSSSIKNPSAESILQKSEARIASLVSKGKWFSDADLKLYQKLELPKYVLKETVRNTSGINENGLLDLIPKNALIDFENGQLQLFFKRRITAVPEKYISQQLKCESLKYSNRYTVGVILEDIAKEYKKDKEVEELINLLKNPISHPAFSSTEAINRISHIQTRLINKDS